MLLKAGRKFTSSNLRNFPSSSTTQTCCSISLLTFDWCSVSITWNENVVWNEQHIVRFKDKNSPRSFRQLELQQVLWESAWEGQLRLSSKNLERQIFTSQVPPSPWGKLRRTWRSVGQVGNCLARASPWLDVAISPEKNFVNCNSHLRFKTHIKHSISLVQDHHGYPAKVGYLEEKQVS